MRLHRLRITAFGPFAGTQEVDFAELSAAGLFLLHGATGAGKTSVLDAVCYALYGTVPGDRQGGQSLRSDHAGPLTPTEVQLDLTVGGRRLEITRRPDQPRPKRRGDGFTREKAQVWLRERTGEGPDGEWEALSRSHHEVGEEVIGLLGMSKEQFCQVVLLPQGEFARFLRADAEARGRLLGRLFDTRRFAAAEERLAELRRSAEKEVTGGDDRLLAIAHRMAQAAGHCADLRDHPLPRLTPGEPGLAGAVLEWAAIARSSARERLDVAVAAARAAETAHRDAQRTSDEARELARLQGAYADACHRSAGLADRSGEIERVRARLDRARSAEAVAPALELRDTAEREHRAAAEALRQCRDRLPQEYAEAGAERLAALERELREELGGLTAAHRSEQRAARIAAERADLDRDARTDDEVLQEADDWLAGWASARSGLQQRIETAREAATRAEQLGGRIDPAVQRLEAAERRDHLAGGIGEADEQWQRRRTQAADARDRWLDLKERRLRGIAAELAAGLRPGEACAVCGGTQHPAPARADAGHVDQATEEAALAAYQQADTEREQAESRLQSLRGALAAAEAAAGSEPVSGLRDAAETLRRTYAEARDAARDAHAAREALARAESEYEQRRAEQQEAGRRTAARTSRREALTRELAEVEAELAAARGGAASVAERTGRLERLTALLAEAAEAVRNGDATARRLKEADARLADAAYRARFDTPQAAVDAVLAEPDRRAMQQRLDQWQAETAAVARELADPQARAAAGLPPSRPASARAAVEAATTRLRDASAAEAAARAGCADLDRLSAEAADDVRQLAPLRERYGRVARLAALAAGTSAENELRMRLESYVLAARLEQVAAAASVRLRSMSSGRYTLVHSDARTSGRGRSGLGLHVIDAWTGRERDTATLSGGETFFASLSLALGLADVVTDEAGGTRLDTLFIDEGFGSLDEQTLDEVLDALDSLRERDRTVGIVSHVADLRQRIPAQLEVVKGRSGSTVRHRLQGATG
ncbi:SMC family ATPase [Streptomyces sp. NPDC004647]|uniref:SMC family ATPase n=1 Tax=Streptomyces sp. NPDC004647 TaxID=3154671 RepID=UPI0033A2BAE3